MDSSDEGAISSPIHISIMQTIYEAATSRETKVFTCQGKVKKKLLCQNDSFRGRERVYSHIWVIWYSLLCNPIGHGIKFFFWRGGCLSLITIQLKIQFSSKVACVSLTR